MKNLIVRNIAASLLATVCAGLLCASAAAQTTQWPTRPIKIVIPFGAGGGTDVIGRFLAQKFTEAWVKPWWLKIAPERAAALVAQRLRVHRLMVTQSC